MLQPLVWTGHADFVSPFEFFLFLKETRGLVFDVMLEAKAKDLALLRLRRDLPRYAPEHAARFGLEPTAVDEVGGAGESSSGGSCPPAPATQAESAPRGRRTGRDG